FGWAVGLSGSDLRIEHNTITEGDTLIAVSFSGQVLSDLTIDDNTITETNHGILVATGGATDGFLTNVTISNDHIHGGDHWECPETGDNAACKGALHRNGIMFFNEDADYGGSVTGLDIHGNDIIWGTNPGSTTAGTAAIFLDGYAMTQYVAV